MQVIKLNHTHRDSIENLFEGNQAALDQFSSTYLSDLKSFHAWGCVENDSVTAFVSLYESHDEPSWYITQYRQLKSNSIHIITDHIIQDQEKRGRLKFYALDHFENSVLSDHNSLRYNCVDEYSVSAKQRCYYTNAWELLFRRGFLDHCVLVQCYYLQQQYRVPLPIGGNL
jgi:hypothetical protein